MISDSFADITPVAEVRPVEKQHMAFTQLDFGASAVASGQTRFSALAERSPWPTAVSGTGEATAGVSRADDAIGSVNLSAHTGDIESAASVRALMLARKFGAGSSREQDSRIEILTARLRKLSPRVTDEQIEFQAEMVSKVEAVSSKLAELRERLNSV